MVAVVMELFPRRILHKRFIVLINKYVGELVFGFCCTANILHVF